MLDLETIVARLQDRNWSYIARKTGLTSPTIGNIARGKYSPTFKTLKAISDYLESNP